MAGRPWEDQAGVFRLMWEQPPPNWVIMERVRVERGEPIPVQVPPRDDVEVILIDDDEQAEDGLERVERVRNRRFPLAPPLPPVFPLPPPIRVPAPPHNRLLMREPPRMVIPPPPLFPVPVPPPFPAPRRFPAPAPFLVPPPPPPQLVEDRWQWIDEDIELEPLFDWGLDRDEGGGRMGRGQTVTAEMIKEAETLRVQDESNNPSTIHYSRACPVCAIENPQKRAVFIDCGHFVCFPCAVENARSVSTYGKCVICRSRGGFVRLFE